MASKACPCPLRPFPTWSQHVVSASAAIVGTPLEAHVAAHGRDPAPEALGASGCAPGWAHGASGRLSGDIDTADDSHCDIGLAACSNLTGHGSSQAGSRPEEFLGHAHGKTEVHRNCQCRRPFGDEIFECLPCSSGEPKRDRHGTWNNLIIVACARKLDGIAQAPRDTFHERRDVLDHICLQGK